MRDMESQKEEAKSPIPTVGLINGGDKDPIKMKNLCKNFGEFKALNDLSLSIKEGEVFCLLGHNGAGKTTAIQVITGILKPSSGSANIYGHDLETDIDGVRQSIGLC